EYYYHNHLGGKRGHQSRNCTECRYPSRQQTYDTAGLQEDLIYGIVSTAVDWAILTHDNLVEPIKDLFGQIKLVFNRQIELQESLKR
ncbi:4518_t:CDS:2, partial [Acaulospora morrowiae]